MPKVSIIIPIYNAEKNLHRCIDSVLKQDYKDFELILVDDGSKDLSGKICDEYAAIDSRVKVIHKENSGVSDSRNLAIVKAEGVYLQFLDSDDWITPEATGLLVNSADKQNCDMVIADFYRVIGERLSQKGNIRESAVLSREEFALEMMENPADFYYGVLWNKLYRRSIVEEHGLRMDKDISWCEDFIFNMEYIRHAKRVYALQVPIYYYVKTPGSLVSQSTSILNVVRMKKTVFKCYREFYQDIFNDEDYEKIRVAVYRFLIDSAGDGVIGPSILPGNYKLGSERISISLGISKEDGFLFNRYREGKLLDRQLEIVALKHNLTFEEVKLLSFLTQVYESYSLKEMSEVMQLKRSKLIAAVQKLTEKEYIRLKSTAELDKKKTKNKIELELLESAEPVIKDLLSANSSFLQIKYDGLTEEEIEQYEILMERVQDNVRNALVSFQER